MAEISPFSPRAPKCKAGLDLGPWRIQTLGSPGAASGGLGPRLDLPLGRWSPASWRGRTALGSGIASGSAVSMISVPANGNPSGTTGRSGARSTGLSTLSGLLSPPLEPAAWGGGKSPRSRLPPRPRSVGAGCRGERSVDLSRGPSSPRGSRSRKFLGSSFQAGRSPRGPLSRGSVLRGSVLRGSVLRGSVLRGSVLRVSPRPG